MRIQKKSRAKTLAKASPAREKIPLIEHLHELKRRLFYVAVCVAVGSGISYALEQKLIALLLGPSHGQHFIYTSPLGGINFIFTVCLYVGIAVSIPIIVYHFLRFVQPLMRDTTSKFIFLGSFASGLVAVIGLVFGYFIGLPSALHFLLHQFPGFSQIQALLSIQSYLSFVVAYMFGSALMFQLPLVLVFINRIKPLKPSKLFHYERFVIVFALIAAFIMNPTPNIMDQMLVVIPIIIMYQVGIALIWYINRVKRPRRKINRLLALDAELQTKRAEVAGHLVPVVPSLSMNTTKPVMLTRTVQPQPMKVVVAQPAKKQAPVVAGRVRPRSYINDFMRPQPAMTPVLRQDAPAS